MYSELWSIIIAIIYVSIIVIYHPFINYFASESNIQHSMLALHKDKNYLLSMKFRENFPTNMLAYLVIYNISVTSV